MINVSSHRKMDNQLDVLGNTTWGIRKVKHVFVDVVTAVTVTTAVTTVFNVAAALTVAVTADQCLHTFEC